MLGCGTEGLAGGGSGRWQQVARRHPRGRVIGAVVVLAVITAGIASVTRPGTSGPDCPSGEPVATVGGVALCTHGHDAGDLGAPPGMPTEAPEATPRAIACVGNGTSGARVQAVYARPQGRTDRYADLLPSLRAAAAEVEHIVARSAAQTGGERHVRWATSTRATSSSCELDVSRVTVPASAASDFRAMVTSLAAQGLDRHDRKYLVWIDSATTACSGIATQLDDDRPGQENYNNTSVGYARVDDSCLPRDGAVEAHELLHLLGAVQPSAPHVSAGGHCSDEWDLLCYDDDGAGPFRTVVRCPTTVDDRRLDCRHDDYFSTDPAPGSYLATHWNAADSRYLEAGAATVPSPGDDPPANDAFATAPLLPGYAGSTPGTLADATLEEGEPGHGGGVTGSTWYKWRPRVTGRVSVDTRGSTGDTVVDVYTGSELTALTRLGGNDDALDLAPQSRVTFNAVAGTTYRIAVSGHGEPVTTVLRWGPPPHGASDVLPGARCETAVGWAVAFRVLPRFDDRTWRPRRTVTRGQGIATLWRLLGSPPTPGDGPTGPTTTTTVPGTTTTSPSTTSTTTAAPTSTRTPPTTTTTAGPSSTSTSVGPAPTLVGEAALPFADVGAANPARAALEWAVTAGVVPPSSAFRPADPLTRADLVAWTWAAAGRPAATEAAAYPDVAPAAAYRPALDWATEHALVTPYGDGRFRPTATVARARLATGLFALAQDRAAWASVPGGARPAAAVY